MSHSAIHLALASCAFSSKHDLPVSLNSRPSDLINPCGTGGFHFGRCIRS